MCKHVAFVLQRYGEEQCCTPKVYELYEYLLSHGPITHKIPAIFVFFTFTLAHYFIKY